MYVKITLVLMFLQAYSAGPVGNNNTIICADYETHTSCLDPCVPSCALPYQRQCAFLVCNEGCLCNNGYKKERYSNGACVPESSCADYCLPFQEYRECGPACPVTCQRSNPDCIDVCNAGCFCQEGFIFDEILELCVKECPFN